MGETGVRWEIGPPMAMGLFEGLSGMAGALDPGWERDIVLMCS